MTRNTAGFVRLYFCILVLIVVELAGCVTQPSTVSPLKPPDSVLPSPMPTSTATVLATATSTMTPQPSSTPLPQPSFTPSPLPSLTPTYPPYADKPFTIVFLRDYNLWLSEIGGAGERQLTHETAEWPIYGFAVSPKGDKIVYSLYRDPPSMDAVIKQVYIPTGSVSILAGENDQCSEYDVQWLDTTHIAFKVSEFRVQEHNDSTCWDGIEPFHHIIADLVTGKKTFVPDSLALSQSPNGRYWLTGSCYYVYQCSREYVLHDRATGEKWRVGESLGWAGFLGWSPDSNLMLFIISGGMGSDRPVQLALVDVTTREAQVVTPVDKDVGVASWSPDGQMIASVQCDAGSGVSSVSTGCALWVMNRDGTNAHMIPTEISTYVPCLAWTPDGSRLIFTQNDNALNTYAVWSVRLDGTDRRPIASATCFQVLYDS